MDDNLKVINSILVILKYVKDKTQNYGLAKTIEWFEEFIKRFDDYKGYPDYTKKIIISYINSISGYKENTLSAELIYKTLYNIDQITKIQNINNIVVSGWISNLVDNYKLPIGETDISLASYKPLDSDPSEETENPTNDPSSEGTRSPTNDPSKETGSSSLILENDPPSEETGSSTNDPPSEGTGSSTNVPPSEGTYIPPSKGLENDPSEETGSPTNVPPEQGAKDEPKKTNTTAFILRVVAITLLVIVAVLGIIFGIGMIIALIYAIRSEEREEKWSTKRVLGRTLLSFGYVAMYWSKYGIW